MLTLHGPSKSFWTRFMETRFHCGNHAGNQAARRHNTYQNQSFAARRRAAWQPAGRAIVDLGGAALKAAERGGDDMEKRAHATDSEIRPAAARRRAAAWIAAGLAAASLSACDQHKTETPVTPPRAQAAVVPGGETTVVPARTGSQSSGVLGSSTVIGAPAPGQAGIAVAH